MPITPSPAGSRERRWKLSRWAPWFLMAMGLLGFIRSLVIAGSNGHGYNWIVLLVNIFIFATGALLIIITITNDKDIRPTMKTKYLNNKYFSWSPLSRVTFYATLVFMYMAHGLSLSRTEYEIGIIAGLTSSILFNWINNGFGVKTSGDKSSINKEKFDDNNFAPPPP
jgi:hypothetical protein